MNKLLVLMILVLGCKQRGSSGLKDRFVDTQYAQSELARVEGACEAKMVPLDDITWANLSYKDQMSWAFGEYSRFPRKDYRARCAGHRILEMDEANNMVHFHTARLRFKLPYNGSCREEYVSFLMCGMRQPGLVKNFVALSKLRMFEGRKLRPFGSKGYLPFVGSDLDADSYGFMPDRNTFNPGTPRPLSEDLGIDEMSFKKEVEDTLRRRSIILRGATKEEIIGATEIRDIEANNLVAITVNRAGLPDTRIALGTKFAFVAYPDRAQEELDGLRRDLTMPVTIGGYLDERSTISPRVLTCLSDVAHQLSGFAPDSSSLPPSCKASFGLDLQKLPPAECTHVEVAGIDIQHVGSLQWRHKGERYPKKLYDCSESFLKELEELAP